MSRAVSDLRLQHLGGEVPNLIEQTMTIIEESSNFRLLEFWPQILRSTEHTCIIAEFFSLCFKKLPMCCKGKLITLP